MRRADSALVRRSIRELLRRQDWDALRDLLVTRHLLSDAHRLLRDAWIVQHRAFLAAITHDDRELKTRIASALDVDGPCASVPGHVGKLPAGVRRTFEEADAKGFLDAIGRQDLRPALPWVITTLLLDWINDRIGKLFPCPVQLDWIEFNHDLTSHSTDALNIRRNFTTPVALPEWQPGMSAAEDSTAAYSLEDIAGQHVTIRVQVSRWRGMSRTVQIRATDGGVLGAIDPIAVDLSGSGVMQLHLPLAHLGLATIGRWDITWQWEYNCSGTVWLPLATTRHRIYAVLRTPQPPWQVVPAGNDQNPWTEAMDVATQLWPGFSSDPIDFTAEGLCNLLNPGGIAPNPFRIQYGVEEPGAPHYAGTGFNLTGLLERARGGEGAGANVNCDDCAGLVVSLANLLGCDLWERQFDTAAMRPVIPLGHGRWWLGFTGFVAGFGDVGTGHLLYHTVAWRGGDAADGKVFDICYLVNGFEDPDHPEQPDPEVRILYYAYGVRFQEAGALDYIEQLHPGAGWSLRPPGRRPIR